MRHDVIVVGGGLGGLSAAAFLAKAGLNVHLFERQAQPGGYATTFVRNGYEFENSLHALSGIGRPDDRGPLWHLLSELGVTEKVEFLSIPTLYRAIAPGLDLRVPADHDGALEALSRAFPHERKGFAHIFDIVGRLQAELRSLTSPKETQASGPLFLLRHPHVSHAAAVPLAHLLDHEVSDPVARLALCQLWTYFGLPPSRLSLLYFAAGLGSYLRYGASYPRGKSQMLSNALMEAIEEQGGRITLGCGVRRILTKRGRVRGVIDDHEERHEAEAVVSNADPLTTAFDLIGPDALPPAFLSTLGASRPSLSSFCVHLGLDAPRDDLGLRDHEIFLSRSADIEAHYRSCLELAAPESLQVTTRDVVDPEFSPKGSTTISLTSLADGEAWSRVNPADYPIVKQRVAQQMLSQAEGMFPGLRERVEVAVIATPITNMRFTGNFGGSVVGFEHTPLGNPGWRLPQKGPLRGLWFAGAWTQPGGGFEPCIVSGYTAARHVVSELRG